MKAVSKPEAITKRRRSRWPSQARAEPNKGCLEPVPSPMWRKASTRSSGIGGWAVMVISRPVSSAAAARPRVRQLGPAERVRIFSN